MNRIVFRAQALHDTFCHRDGGPLVPRSNPAQRSATVDDLTDSNRRGWHENTHHHLHGKYSPIRLRNSRPVGIGFFLALVLFTALSAVPRLWAEENAVDLSSSSASTPDTAAPSAPAAAPTLSTSTAVVEPVASPATETAVPESTPTAVAPVVSAPITDTTIPSSTPTAVEPVAVPPVADTAVPLSTAAVDEPVAVPSSIETAVPTSTPTAAEPIGASSGTATVPSSAVEAEPVAASSSTDTAIPPSAVATEPVAASSGTDTVQASTTSFAVNNLTPDQLKEIDRLRRLANASAQGGNAILTAEYWKQILDIDPTDPQAKAAVAGAEAQGIHRSTATYDVDGSTDMAVLEKVSIDDAGNRLLVILQASKPIECFVFERRDPPSLFVQFVGSGVFAGGDPIQVVGTDPLSEIRYGYSDFQAATAATRDMRKKQRLEYLELRLSRPVFYHVQQEGWVVVVGLDRSTTKVEVPDLDFRFEKAKYEGAANLPENPRMDDFVTIAQANSRLLSVSRDEAELAKSRVTEAKRALLPALTARASHTDGKEVNPFPSENFDGFEATTYKREEIGMQVNQPIYQSGRLYGAMRQAKLNRAMAIENVRKQAQDLTYEMKKAYVSLLKNQSILRIRRELVAQGEVIKDMVGKKHDLELTSKSEVLNVAAQADQSSYQLTSDEQDVALARLVVISLLNQSQPAPDPIPGALSFARLSFNVESIISWAQEHRPDVRIATLNMELAKYNMKAADAENGVHVDASGFVGSAGSAFAGDEFEMKSAWNVGVRASKAFWGSTLRGSYSNEHTAPDLGQTFVTDTEQKTVELGILDGMPAESNARQSSLQYERAKAELVEASRKAEFEVRQTYYNLEKSGRQLDAVREDLKYRQKDLEITREKVKLGLAELSQLMAAEVAYSQSQITEQDALSAYNIALAEMDRVAGAEVVRQ